MSGMNGGYRPEVGGSIEGDEPDPLDAPLDERGHSSLNDPFLGKVHQLAKIGIAVGNFAAGFNPIANFITALADQNPDGTCATKFERASAGFGVAGPMFGELGNAARATEEVPWGSFSIIDWRGYPDGIARPTGPFRILRGQEYEDARKAADAANKALHRLHPEWADKQIHEIHPVKFGGSPTDIANKVALSPAEHRPYTNWWEALKRAMIRGTQ